jgi:hypothetical protein
MPRTDTLYAAFTLDSHLLPASRPWLYRVGDVVRVGRENVLVLDGFLHVRRALGAYQNAVPAGTTVLIIAAVSEGERL